MTTRQGAMKRAFDPGGELEPRPPKAPRGELEPPEPWQPALPRAAGELEPDAPQPPGDGQAGAPPQTPGVSRKSMRPSPPMS